jgi:hypothetical protein
MPRSSKIPLAVCVLLHLAHISRAIWLSYQQRSADLMGGYFVTLGPNESVYRGLSFLILLFMFSISLRILLVSSAKLRLLGIFVMTHILGASVLYNFNPFPNSASESSDDFLYFDSLLFVIPIIISFLFWINVSKERTNAA